MYTLNLTNVLLATATSMFRVSKSLRLKGAIIEWNLKKSGILFETSSATANLYFEVKKV